MSWNLNCRVKFSQLTRTCKVRALLSFVRKYKRGHYGISQFRSSGRPGTASPTLLGPLASLTPRKILLQTFLAQRNCIFLLILSLKIVTFQKISTFDVMTAHTQLTGGGTKNQTKRVAQNTYSIKYCPSDTQEYSKFVFEKSSNPL